MSASEVIKELRKKLGVNRKTLAEKLGLKGEFIIYQYENGKRFPSRITWQKIAEVAEEAGMSLTVEMMKDSTTHFPWTPRITPTE